MVRKADEVFSFRESQRSVRDWKTTKDGKKSINLLHVNKFKNGYTFDLKIKLCNYKPRIEDIFKKNKPQQEYYYVAREYATKSSIDKAIRIGLRILDMNKCYPNPEISKLLSKLPKEEEW